MEPNGVFHLVQHIDLAALGLGTERLNDPSDVVFQTPDDGVPFAFGIDVVQGVVVRVDLELGGGDYPVGRGVGRVGGVDVGGVGGEVEVKVEMVDGVAPRGVGDGVVIDARCCIGVAVPFESVAVSAYVFHASFNDLVHIEGQVDDAVAAVLRGEGLGSGVHPRRVVWQVESVLVVHPGPTEAQLVEDVLSWSVLHVNIEHGGD